MGGPIFTDTDPVYRGVQLPKRFWKIIYFREVGDETIKAKGFVAVFGSYAKGQQRKGSDLDVFIAGTAEIRKTALPIHIDPKKYPLQTFKSRKDSDFLAGEVIRHHIIIQGVEEFVGICYEKYDNVVLTPEDRLKAPGAGRTER